MDKAWCLRRDALSPDSPQADQDREQAGFQRGAGRRSAHSAHAIGTRRGNRQAQSRLRQLEGQQGEMRGRRPGLLAGLQS